MNPQHIYIALTLANAMFIQSFSHSSLGTALPAIAADFGLDPLRLSVAVTAEALTLAAFMPMSGWLAGRFGSRRVFFAAVLLFAAATAGCALSRSLEMLVGFRALQGIGGAMMVPVSRLVLLLLIPRNQLVQAMTWVTIPALMGVVLGPPVAGALVTYLHWTALFWVVLPFCAMLFALAWVKLEDSRDADAPPFDWPGVLLSALGIAGLLLALDRLAHGADGMTALGLAGVSALLLLAYLRHARTAAAPIIDLRLLQVPAYRIAVLGGVVFRSAQSCVPFLLPILFQTVFGWSALLTGGLMLSSALAAFLVKFAAPVILHRAGFRGVLVWNGIMTALGIVACAGFGPGTPHAAVVVVLFMVGWMRSLQYTALNVLTYSDLNEKEMTQATGVSSMLQQLAEAFGVGMSALVMQLATRGDQAAGGPAYIFAFVFFGCWALAAQVFFIRLRPEHGAQAGLGGARRGYAPNQP